MEPAPFFADVAEAPGGETCVWLDTADGVRVRAAFWRAGAKGTVLLFPGRTEYVEKYGPAAAEFAARGYAMATIDWRGQGIADRLLDDRAPGHVGRFSDYQHDVAALVALLRAERLPEPWFLVGHSMGGCIALRALYTGLGVRAAAFSAPMWGIRMHAALRPVAWSLASLAPLVGLGARLVPSTSALTYVLEAPYEGNLLTRDRDMYEFMQRQLTAHPDLAIGGPTLTWLREALRECRDLGRRASPRVPCLTVLGRSERIVNIPAIEDRMARWPGAEFHLVDDAEHELMMERPAIRTDFFDRAAALFGAHRD